MFKQQKRDTFTKSTNKTNLFAKQNVQYHPPHSTESPVKISRFQSNNSMKYEVLTYKQVCSKQLSTNL